MAKEPIEPEAEVLETPEIDEAEDQVQPETEEQQEEPSEPEAEAEEEETVIGFGDEDEEEPEGEETPTIKRLRERNREQTRLLREREKRIQELEQTAPKKIELGPEPTLEDCEWDGELLKERTREYDERKKQIEAQEATEQQKYTRVIESYNRDLENYTARKATIGVPDFEEAEAVVVSALSQEQQAVALQAANDPAALVVALAKSPSKLAELAKIDNPWKLSAAIAKLEGSVKVVTRKKGPNIDRPARGSASMASASADEKLEKLEKEAAKTGDRTAVIAYKRSLKAQEK